MRAVALMTASLFAAAAVAQDHVWVIGGGNNPDNSQAQIEFNVNYVIDVLHRQARQAQLHVSYTDGDATGKDVNWSVKISETNASLQPLARVFGEQEANSDQYRNHAVREARATTEANALKGRLAEEFARLRVGDRALIVYNGHGLRDPNDAAGNTLRLWGDTTLSARELEPLLGRIDPGVPVRFIFTQCYSGGFARLIRPGARDVANLADGQRCGFFAESEDREAEGCSASVNIGDYRDYTTYFFAALSGRTRTGAPIHGNPDRDGDGVVTLHEAHLYVLREAYNADLPRATSEVYLERWQPWYLRWFDTAAEPDNVYGQLARELAHTLNLPESGRGLAKELARRRADLQRQMDRLEAERETRRETAKALQRELQHELGLRWPEVRHPHTRNYVSFLRGELDAAQEFIRRHPKYPELVAAQDRASAIREELLRVDREATQLDKIRRLRHLARLSAQFERYASAHDRAEYARLTGCERQPL